jgi:hypothetical protein
MVVCASVRHPVWEILAAVWAMPSGFSARGGLRPLFCFLVDFVCGHGSFSEGDAEQLVPADGGHVRELIRVSGPPLNYVR